MTVGIVNVLKPPGMTSHDVVSFIRKLYGLKRVGHAGTLDPAAAGVLPVFLGQATRLIEYATDTDKSYRAELTFGIETDTGDDTGKVIETAEVVMPSEEKIIEVLNSFRGAIRQTPPMYSAIKIDGRKMYELAREGIHVDLPEREIFIEDIVLLERTENGILFDVTCSKGTYIRSLCVDIGRKLHTPAVMSFLVRTRVGNFSLNDAKTLEELEVEKVEALIPLDFALQHMEAVVLDLKAAEAFLHGKMIQCDKQYQGLLRIYHEKNGFIGIARQLPDSYQLKPLKVLPLIE